MASSWVRAVPLAMGALGLAWTGCDDGLGESAPSGDEAAITAGACSVFSAIAQRPLTHEELAKKSDPVAQKLLRGEGCPQNFDEITAKLSRTESSACADNGGIITRLVSDSAFLTGKKDGAYRAVMTRDCDDVGNNLFVSLFGVRANAPKLPQEQTELIGFDQTSGVFNFYVRESRENRWVFMGSSEDGIAQGYVCDDDGGCLPKAAKDARCWACHESGGLNMKELRSPWTGWAVGRPLPPHEVLPAMPGLDEVFAKFGGQLGTPGAGIELERRVERGNHDWNAKRIEILKSKGAAELLRPLFCTVSTNLQDGGGAMTFLDTGFFVHEGASQITGLSVDNADYLALIKENGQRVMAGQGQLVGPKGPVLDINNQFRHVERGEIDTSYIRELVSKGLIDDDFVRDVHAIDVTRTVFSKTRCDLLGHAPTLSGAELTPDKIREGFKANLRGATGAAAELLKSLEDRNDGAAHQKVVRGFLDACGARPRKELLRDVLLYNGHVKRALKRHRGSEGAGKGQGIIEFPETLPVDDLPDTEKAFDPTTCTLR
jgi:hypothetical protein